MISKTPVAREIVRPLDVKGAWAAMEECKKLGLTKAIGVSNFATKTMEEILSSATIPPAVNQVSVSKLNIILLSSRYQFLGLFSRFCRLGQKLWDRVQCTSTFTIEMRKTCLEY